MKNVTISMDDELAAWARVEAAKAGMSLSRWLAERLKERRQDADRLEVQRRAIDAWLSGPKWPLTADGRLPTREELYAKPIAAR